MFFCLCFVDITRIWFCSPEQFFPIEGIFVRISYRMFSWIFGTVVVASVSRLLLKAFSCNLSEMDAWTNYGTVKLSGPTLTMFHF